MDTRAIPEQALDLVMPAVKKLLTEYAKREHGHFVIMDPTKLPWECSFEQAIWYEHSLEDGQDWEYDYKAIAMSKAQIAWKNQQSGIITTELAPALLRSGDTFYPGSFYYHGVIVAFSGVEWYFDMLISGWVALAIQQLSKHYIQKHRAAYPDEDFMP